MCVASYSVMSLYTDPPVLSLCCLYCGGMFKDKHTTQRMKPGSGINRQENRTKHRRCPLHHYCLFKGDLRWQLFVFEKYSSGAFFLLWQGAAKNYFEIISIDYLCLPLETLYLLVYCPVLVLHREKLKRLLHYDAKWWKPDQTNEQSALFTDELCVY